MTEISLRALKSSDYEGWLPLWQGYLEFYQTALSAEQTELTWQRLCDEDFDLFGVVAVADGQLAGIAHFSPAISSWSVDPDVYLEDLFVDPALRGAGIGRALIEYVTQLAATNGARKVFWQTHRDNTPARALYDTLGKLSEFVIYEKFCG
jgi:GNAT superfamily N-acetyltransferase